MNAAIKLDYFGGHAPIQAWGRFDNHNFYFRARWDEWRFEIGKSGIEVPTSDENHLIFIRKGELLPDTFHEGLSDVIISCFQEYFTESKNPQITSLLSDLKTNLQAMIKRE